MGLVLPLVGLIVSMFRLGFLLLFLGSLGCLIGVRMGTGLCFGFLRLLQFFLLIRLVVLLILLSLLFLLLLIRLDILEPRPLEFV